MYMCRCVLYMYSMCVIYVSRIYHLYNTCCVYITHVCRCICAHKDLCAVKSALPTDIDVVGSRLGDSIASATDKLAALCDAFIHSAYTAFDEAANHTLIAWWGTITFASYPDSAGTFKDAIETASRPRQLSPSILSIMDTEQRALWDSCCEKQANFLAAVQVMVDLSTDAPSADHLKVLVLATNNMSGDDPVSVKSVFGLDEPTSRHNYTQFLTTVAGRIDSVAVDAYKSISSLALFRPVSKCFEAFMLKGDSPLDEPVEGILVLQGFKTHFNVLTTSHTEAWASFVNKTEELIDTISVTKTTMQTLNEATKTLACAFKTVGDLALAVKTASVFRSLGSVHKLFLEPSLNHIPGFYTKEHARTRIHISYKCNNKLLYYL